MPDVQATGQIPGIWLVMYILATIGLGAGGRAAAAAVPFISVVLLSATAIVPWRYNIYFNPDCALLLVQVRRGPHPSRTVLHQGRHDLSWVRFPWRNIMQRAG